MNLKFFKWLYLKTVKIINPNSQNWENQSTEVSKLRKKFTNVIYKKFLQKLKFSYNGQNEKKKLCTEGKNRNSTQKKNIIVELIFSN